MFASRLLICAVGIALAVAAPNTRSDANGSQAKLTATSAPMNVVDCGSRDECYRVDVFVGTPPQKYRLTLDNTMYEAIHVFSSNMSAPNSTCKSVDISRKHFNPSESSTYVENGESQFAESGGSPWYPYEDPKCTKDHFGFKNASGFNDTVQIGSVSLPSVPAYLINDIEAPLNPEWDADGFLGIHPPDFAFDDRRDTLNVFLSAFESPAVTFYYARVDYFDKQSDKGGVLTLGGADTSNCDSEWTNIIPSSSAFFGELMIETVSIKGTSIRSWQYAGIGLTTSFITAPQTAIDAVVKATGAEYDFNVPSGL